jgi:transcriptional regulator with XRE-family HTH domain
MIRNDNQLATARRKIEGLEATRDAMTETVGKMAYDKLISVARREVEEYVAIRAGAVRSFNVNSLDEIGEAATKARLASGMTQKQVADELSVTEQMVQKDESRGYESAGVAKLAEVLDILGYELVGCVRPKQNRFVPPSLSGTSASNLVPTSSVLGPANMMVGSGKSFTVIGHILRSTSEIHGMKLEEPRIDHSPLASHVEIVRAIP